MEPPRTRVGACGLFPAAGPVAGRWVDLDGEPFYRIEHHDRLDPFFLTVVSDSDHWLFVSSNGALTAGRRSPEHALFPYETDDKIHDAAGRTGPRTAVRLERGDDDDGGALAWEPFSDRYAGIYDIARNLYRNTAGNKLVFEEINRSLGLAFRYAWLLSDRFGFVRRARLTNLGDREAKVRFLDGLLNLMPANVDRGMQNGFSTLVDAYKRAELLPGTGIGIFSLSSIPVDRAEPSESLAANTVWSTGLAGPRHLLSVRQLPGFLRGGAVVGESDVRGRRGAYLVESGADLPPGGHHEWFLVADVDQTQGDVVALDQWVAAGGDLAGALVADVDRGTRRLEEIVAQADGRQATGDRLQSARHFANTLFNVMRGGVFADGYQVDRGDLVAFLHSANRSVAERHAAFLEALPERFSHPDHVRLFREPGDPDLERLYLEYLPLTFSRRHGDPSRPWNAFSIDVRNPDGSTRLSYQGNWRDIFQNWEALGFSYPGFLEGMVVKFVNASTADGYNPYRITRDGIDWEVPDPEDPWSNIGYWGDHQIVYLLRLLERLEASHPGRLDDLLGRDIFVHAHVPYRIKPYGALLEDPRDTIEFDRALHERLIGRSGRIGSDGRLLHDSDGRLVRVNLVEKLLVPILAKLANFVPEAGIWMNTQRPEWNDANNALVGSGVSMVTLCHLRRHLAFCARLLGGSGQGGFRVSAEVVAHFREIGDALRSHAGRLRGGFDSRGRREMLDAVGESGGRYREALYRSGHSGERRELPVAELVLFLELAGEFLEQSIAANRRDDGLYHSYNLMQIEGDGGITIRRLDEMLEGQVAVLSSGVLDARSSVRLLEALRASALYRADQRSYLLYPDRELPGFLDKNLVPESAVDAAPVIGKMLAAGDGSVVLRDAAGNVRFHPSFRNAGDLARALDGLRDCSPAERSSLLAVYEEVFDHRSFTGRSGVFFKYEGLGCIYWHMVSKLLVAVQEACVEARARGEGHELVDRLVDGYREVQQGIGAHKPVSEQGAFPIDPYSHTPSMMGAQQPGLTGQVKEDFIARMTELGIRVEGGVIRFDPFLVPDTEFLSNPVWFAGRQVGAGALAATFCGVPVIIRKARREGLRVWRRDGGVTEIDGLALDRSLSREVFSRSGSVVAIEVSIVR